MTPAAPAPGLVPVFDLDGTLLDSDRALVSAFVACGISTEEVTFGHVLADECARFGIAVDRYLDAYDPALAEPFPGVEELLARVGRWGVCSNKAERSGRAELARWGWSPEVALFAEAFGGGPKRVGPVLDALGVTASETLFIGDTAHDRACALDAGCGFILAGWNRRATAEPGDHVARHPGEVFDMLAADRRP